MTIHIDFGVRQNCWNLIDSYGEICVRCGCCSPDKKVRYPARLRCLQNWLEERKTFKYWSDDPYWLDIQKKNVSADIKLFKRRIRYYKKKLKEIGSRCGSMMTRRSARTASADGQDVP